MNGRVFAVNRSPVLAWNVDPQLQQGPPHPSYPDMPAAAAISPVVPAAATDPYGRCWQNQHVDTGTGPSFPYFGALYNNSLPPTAYRLQPGCMPALGQFWPPTPPPDGCGRFDGSNLYFGPPVLRHTENISSNIRGSFQGLGHYSHLVETSKEQSQRLFKRETPISPNVSVPNIAVCSSVSKTDNFNSCCVVDSKMKSPISVAYSLPKQELHTVSSGHEPYLCSSDIRSSSMHHPSTDKSHFSPSHSLKNTLHFHNTATQDSTHRTKAMPGNQENCNASPLKNVYFSHYESENINSIHSKIFEKSSSADRQFQYESKPNSSLNRNKPVHLHQSLPNNYLQSYSSNKKYDFQGSQEHLAQNGSLNCANSRSDGVTLIKEKYKQKSTSSYKVKPEKSPSDCKYQKRPVQEYKNSEMFNIPTSVLHAKIEPKDKYFLPSCSSTAPSCMAASYATSGSFLPLSADLRTGYQNSIYQNSCAMGKSWHYSDLPAISLENYFRAPEAARPPSQNPPHVSSALHEGLISVAQTAPQDIRMLHNVQQPPAKRKAQEVDDDVQIIGVQTKHSSSKHDSRHSSERKPNCHLPIPVSEPLYLKSEKEEVCSKPPLPITEENQITLDPSPSKPPPLQKEENIKPIIENRTENVSPNCTNLEMSFPCKPVTIKQELLNENELPIINCTELPQEQPALVSELPQEQPALVSELPQEQPALVSELPREHPALTSELPQEQPALVSELPQEQPALVYSEKPSLDSNVNNKDILCKSLYVDETVVKSDILELDQETDYNENHGLNLLLNTIEKITLFQKVKCPNTTIETLPLLENTSYSPKELPMIRGLDLLSAIAGQRLVSEFDLIKTETDEEHIKCNYPEIKETKLLPDEEQSKQVSETLPNAPKSSVSEIQNILVELKKKYKQKQKELSRLKPKHRFASSYLKGRQKTIKKEFDQSPVSTSGGTTTDTLNSSFSSVCSELDQHDPASNSKSKLGCKKDLTDNKPKRVSRMCTVKKEPSLETELLSKRVTRRTLGQSKSGDKILEVSEQSKTIKRNSRSKACKLRKSPNTSAKEIPQSSDVSPSKATTLSKEVVKKSNSLPENKRRKVYSLRQSSQNSNRKADSLADNSAIHPKAISSKRKSDNPKKYVPSKQSKLSETIVAKHLRNRILFDASGSTSDDENLKDGVPDDLYVAFEDCHLGEETKNANKLVKNTNAPKLPNGGSLAYPEPSRLCPENLIERQRLLALEDGLFYAGCIKEYQVSKRYGIALDGQRGNRLHMFTREELLTQTIVESKPLSSELPEGTRVCAYWSQQYRCLYPGVVGKAPCPSADWSEPRVFVLFDDGDSGQIPAKNVRLIPPDIIPAENICRSDSSNTSTSNANLKSRSSSRGQSRRMECSMPKDTKHSDTSNENESKESSCASVNESSCDDSCFVDYSLSPSHTTEDPNSPSVPSAKSAKRQKKRSKRRTSRRVKLDAAEPKSEAKTKRHKKYKEKHRRHHHHHHRHHHHHHHHHHSKKRRHRRKKDLSQDSETCNGGNLKSCKDSTSDLMGHSNTENLPQGEQDMVC